MAAEDPQGSILLSIIPSHHLIPTHLIVQPLIPMLWLLHLTNPLTHRYRQLLKYMSDGSSESIVWLEHLLLWQ